MTKKIEKEEEEKKSLTEAEVPPNKALYWPDLRSGKHKTATNLSRQQTGSLGSGTGAAVRPLVEGGIFLSVCFSRICSRISIVFSDSSQDGE